MSNLIISPGNSLEAYYDQTLDYLYNQYHSHSPHTLDVYIDDSMLSELSCYERMAQNMSDQSSSDSDIPLGKLVI